MPNVIKSATTISAGTIKRNNFLIGVDTSIPYGPTDNGVVVPAIDVTSTRTFFWNGITPPPSGYVVYTQKASGGPCILVATGDTQLIQLAIQNGGSNINTITDALNYFNSQSNYLVANIEYPSIVTSGLTLMLDAGYVPSYPETGSTWNDLSGNNNNATLSGSPTFNSGVSSFTFASNKNARTTLSNVALSAATFIAWVYPTQTQGNYTGIIFNRTGNGGSTVPATGLNFYTSSLLGYTWNDAVATYNWNSGLTVPTNRWSMVAVTVNSTSATAYLYNSGSTSSATNTTTHPSLSGMNFYIDTDPLNGSARSFIGRLSISMIYNRALSSTEILQNYNATVSRFSLLQYFDFANTASYPTTGSTVTDLSGNGNTGTLVGSPTFNTANGGSIVLNGSSQYINAGSPTLQTSWTLEIWAYMTDATSFALFGQGTTLTNQGLHIYYTTGARGMVFAFYSNDNDYGNNYRPSLSTWYHWVFTYNVSTYEKQFYANGVLQTPTSSVQNIYQGSGQFNVGGTYSAATQKANGRIGFFRRYSSVLSASQILENYNSALPRYS